jgi:hypothetical protein
MSYHPAHRPGRAQLGTRELLAQIESDRANRSALARAWVLVAAFITFTGMALAALGLGIALEFIHQLFK